MYPHRIRLRGPWEFAAAASWIAPGQATLPARWGDAGPVTFTRKFGYPGRIDEGEHIWLTCDRCTGCSEIRLNDQSLGQFRSIVDHDRLAFDVSAILGQRNRLEILIDGGARRLRHLGRDRAGDSPRCVPGRRAGFTG